MPLSTKAYFSNSSDKEIIIEAMKRLQQKTKFPDYVYYIADSALYSEGNIVSSIFKCRIKAC